MPQTLTYYTGGAFLSAASAACAAVMVSAAPTIAAAEPSRAPITNFPPEIFILRLLMVVTEDLDPQRGAPAPCSPSARLETSRTYSRVFILLLFSAALSSMFDC